MSNALDISYMRKALALAERGLGRVWPNPSVGCLLVKDDHILSHGLTADGGRPHAEVKALNQAGAAAKGACAYVTLEPCNHEGETPSCAQELIHAGVSRVVIACLDPDPRTSGQGAERLRNAGIEVHVGVLENEAKAINKGFFMRIHEGRPFVALKCATSLDGKIAMKSGESKWITGEAARTDVHRKRASFDAILTGVGTVKADNPNLNVRLSNVSANPVRVIFDGDLETPPEAKILQGQGRVYILHNSSKEIVFPGDNVELIKIDTRDLEAVLAWMGKKGFTRVMVEAGPTLLGSFLQSGFYDEIFWYRAPKILGGSAKGVSDLLQLEQLSQAQSLKRVKTLVLGEDLLEIYARDR